MNIQAFLERTHQTGTELAAKLNVDGSAVSNWCKGKNTPKYTVCLQLLKMGVKIEEIFDEEAAETIKKDILTLQNTSKMTDRDCEEIVKRGMAKLLFQGNQTESNGIQRNLTESVVHTLIHSYTHTFIHSFTHPIITTLSIK